MHRRADGASGRRDGVSGRVPGSWRVPAAPRVGDEKVDGSWMEEPTNRRPGRTRAIWPESAPSDWDSRLDRCEPPTHGSSILPGRVLSIASARMGPGAGGWPSGKAADSGSADRRFESFPASHCVAPAPKGGESRAFGRSALCEAASVLLDRHILVGPDEEAVGLHETAPNERPNALRSREQADGRPRSPLPSTDRADIAVVGGGILGLATAYRLLERRPDLRLALLERESDLALHQTGHNSGVVHAGLFYAPGSLKARLCREGKAELEAFAAEHGVPYERVGKLVVAVEDPELPRLQALFERASANGVPGIELVGPERIREHEPHVRGHRAIWSPTTGIIDFRTVARALAAAIQERGGTIETDRAVTGLAERSGGVVLETSRGPLVSSVVVVCAGLWADRLVALSGHRPKERIVPFRGDYYTLVGDARRLVRGLVYPVPDPRLPFLGVHFTRRIDGSVWAGPNAILALARAGYRRRDVDLRDLAEILVYPGFLRLAARHWTVGLAELWRDLSKRAYLAELRRFIPDLRADDLVFGPSGVRAQAVDPDGTLVDDFRLGGSRRILHVRNAPSPAATASLAIGRILAREAIDRFGYR